MDSGEGWFHEVEKDGKVFELVYHYPKYDLISQSQWLTSHRQNHIFQPLFLCPFVRALKAQTNVYTNVCPINSSSLISSPTSTPNTLFTTNSENHHLSPSFRCNEFGGYCYACTESNLGTEYYFCESCGKKYHKGCVESPPQIKHPYHPKHSVQLYIYYDSLKKNKKCYCCKRTILFYLMYCCITCEIFMHPICAMKSITFVIDPPKRHDHPLVFFTRQSPLTCNVCGLMRESIHTYICVRCNFVSHNDCMHSPHIIKISRHPHRISYIASLSSRGRSCGVCHKKINGDYGAYACNKCNNYVVHSKCALKKDVWDGQDLKDVPEEDSITPKPFDIISEGVILYFLHEHRLLLEVNMIYDENKFCQACALPIFEGNIYSCKMCDYILHETCANAPRKIQHALHLHTLTLKSSCQSHSGLFMCNACERFCGGFVYECTHEKENQRFKLDIKCALISEQFMYHGHKHPLFLGFEQVEYLICRECNTECRKHFQCVECSTCDYIVCIKCATIPYKMGYKHDKHFLTFSCENEVSENDYCDVCEYNLKDSKTKGFYWCKECYTTLHIDCLFGEDSYVKHDTYDWPSGRFQVLKKIKDSRPICENCKKRCQSTIFVTELEKSIFCSRKCFYSYFPPFRERRPRSMYYV